MSDGKTVALDTRSDGSVSLASVHQESPKDTVNIFIGPEGGWSDTEVDTFKQKGFKLVHASGRIMRTETAGIVTAFALLQS